MMNRTHTGAVVDAILRFQTPHGLPVVQTRVLREMHAAARTPMAQRSVHALQAPYLGTRRLRLKLLRQRYFRC